MTLYKRVAIFFAPEAGTALADFGANWLGWDVEKAINVSHPNITGLPAPIDVLVSTPKKYGFHGTLKAPFKLKNTYELADICAKMASFSATKQKFDIGIMQVTQLGNFVAITPYQPCDELRNFASDIVKNFDEFRQPLSDKDIARRRKAKLTPRQDDLMLKWGYPFIFEEFKFHLTLTGKLAENDAKMVKDILSEYLLDMLSKPVKVVDLCLYGEREDGRFEITERFPLSG